MASIPLYENLARDSTVKDRLKKELFPVLRHTRNDRRTMREMWLRWWRIWSVQPDQEAYKGRVQNYIPVGRRIAEQWIHRILQSMFPSEEWFGVRALRHSLTRREPLVKALFKFYFEKHMRLRRHARPFVRQLVTLGTSPVKVVWKIAERDIPIVRDLYDPLGEPVATEEKIERVLDYIGPTFRTVDLFGFYVWPPVVMDVDDATLAFEDMLLDQATIQRKGDQLLDPEHPELGHEYENVDTVLEHLRSLDMRDRVDAERRRLADKGFTHPTDASLPVEMAPVDVTEVVWRTDLDGTGVKRWLVVVGAEDIPLRVQPVPWWHGKSPWLVGKFLEVENEFYGRSLMEMIDKLQYFVNDVSNQASDALVWSINPISIVDMFKIHDPNSLRFRPGAKWLGEPGAVEFTEPPKDSAVTGFNAMGQLISLMRESTEPGPVSMPVGRQRSRAAQTAVVQQLAAAESMTPIRDVVESLEDQVFKPLLYMMHVLSWQCLDRDLVLQIASVEGAPLAERKISVQDIVGDFEFTWLGSTTAMNLQVRAQQMITFLGMVARIPPEALQQEGIRVKMGNLLKAIWVEGFQLPQAERVIEEVNKQVTIDPRIENDLFRLGRGDDVIVSEGDNDDEHLRIHQLALDVVPADEQPKLAKHMQSHQAAKIAKRLLEVQRQAQMGQLVRGGNGGGGVGFPPGRPPSTNDLGDVFRSMPRGTT